MSKKGSEKIPLKVVLKALEENRGMVYLAARSINCTAKTIYNYRAKHPEIQEMIDAQRGAFLDQTECALEEAVMRGEGWAVCFTLKCLGKDRGYVERSEFTGADGAPLFDPLAKALEKAYGSERGNNEEGGNSSD